MTDPVIETNEAPSKKTDQALLDALERLDYPALLEARAHIGRLITEQRERAMQAARNEAEQVAQRYGLGLDEIASNVSSNARKKVPPKFRHPDGHTWAGRGRKPLWVRDWEAQGGSIEDLRIEGAQV